MYASPLFAQVCYTKPSVTELEVCREKLQAAFASDNIDARVFSYPLSSLPSLGLGPGAPHAADIASRAGNLPSFHDITQLEQARVIDRVAHVLQGYPHAA